MEGMSGSSGSIVLTDEQKKRLAEEKAQKGTMATAQEGNAAKTKVETDPSADQSGKGSELPEGHVPLGIALKKKLRTALKKKGFDNTTDYLHVGLGDDDEYEDEDEELTEDFVIIPKDEVLDDEDGKKEPESDDDDLEDDFIIIPKDEVLDDEDGKKEPESDDDDLEDDFVIVPKDEVVDGETEKKDPEPEEDEPEVSEKEVEAGEALKTKPKPVEEKPASSGKEVEAGNALKTEPKPGEEDAVVPEKEVEAGEALKTEPKPGEEDPVVPEKEVEAGDALKTEPKPVEEEPVPSEKEVEAGTAQKEGSEAEKRKSKKTVKEGSKDGGSVSAAAAAEDSEEEEEVESDVVVTDQAAVSYYEGTGLTQAFLDIVEAQRVESMKKIAEQKRKDKLKKEKEEKERKEAEEKAKKEAAKKGKKSKGAAAATKQGKKSEAAAGAEKDKQAPKVEEKPEVLHSDGLKNPVWLPDGIRYIRQDPGSNDCFAITAAAMYNQHLIRKNGAVGNDGITHKDVRGYRPGFKTYKDFRDHSLEVSELEYMNERSTVARYTTPRDTTMGNIYMLSDMFFQLDQSVCTNNMTFRYNGLTPEAHKALQDYFLKTVSEVLQKGEAVGYFKERHYMTIVGISGSKVYYYDSMKDEEHLLQHKQVWDILSGEDGTVDLTFLSDRSEIAKKEDEYEGLSVEGDHYVSSYCCEGKNDIAHTLGVDTERKKSVMLEKGLPEALEEHVNHQVYIPKKAKTEKLNMRVHRKRVEVYTRISAEQEYRQLFFLQHGYYPKKESPAKRGAKEPAVKKTAKSKQSDDPTAAKKTAKSKQSADPDAAKKTASAEPDSDESAEKEAVAEGVVVEDTDLTKVVVDAVAKRELEKRANEVPAAFKQEDMEKTYRFGPTDRLCAYADVFISNPHDQKEHIFSNLRFALEDNQSMLRDIEAGSFAFTQGDYQEYLRVYQAASAYVAKYTLTTDKKKLDLLEAAKKIKAALDKVSLNIIVENQVPDVDYNVIAGEEEQKAAILNVERFLGAYRSYCVRVDDDIIATDEEKIRRKWDALKSSERDVLIYLSYKKSLLKGNEPLKGEDAFLDKEFTSLKRQALLLRLTKSGTEAQKEVQMNPDDDLTDDKIAALSTIDTWLIRNIRNGGLMAASGIVADRTDLVGEILKMSRRRRLYIYYLVETRERVNPSPDGFIKSQTDYVPNIKEFKNKMIASKLKFYKRFTGGYIYWHKLTEAIGIAHRADPMISVAEKCLKKDVFINEQSANMLDDAEEAEETGSAASKKKTMSVEEKRKQAVGLMLQNAMTSMRLIKENAKPDISLTQKAMNQQMISTLAEDSKKLLERLSYYATQMRAEKIQAYTHRDGLETYGRDMFQDGYKITRVAVGVVDDAGAAALDYFADIDIGQVSQYFTIGPNGLGAIGMMVGALFSFYNVIEGHAAMTGLDITANLASGVRGLGFTAKGITNIVGLFKENSAITAIGGPVAATALAGVEAGVAIVKGVSYKRNSDYRKKAKDLASKKTSQDELTKAMLELNEKLGKRERTGFVTSAITAACSLTAAIVMLTAPVTAGAGLFAGAAILGVGMYAKGKDSDYAREMKLSLFDSYYKMDDKFTAALVEYNRRNPRLPLTDDEKFKLYDQLRRRVAVQQGFYSPSHAAKFVAEQYAKDMLFRAHFGPDQDMYIAMIKGLGLSYKYDLSKNKDIPTVSDIVKKMCK